MITFRIGDRKFEYHTPKDNAWDVVPFSEFVLDACDLASHEKSVHDWMIGENNV